jgi:hypothetical protein
VNILMSEASLSHGFQVSLLAPKRGFTFPTYRRSYPSRILDSFSRTEACELILVAKIVDAADVGLTTCWLIPVAIL